MRPYFLIYASYATRDWTDQELFDLLRTSRLRNSRRGITGLLVYAQRRFLQIIEGDQSQVLALYSSIKDHPGHKNAQVLLDDELEDRLFPDWSMGFERLDEDELSSISGYTDIDQFIQSLGTSHPVFSFVKLFYNKNFQEQQEGS
ncbi:MAG: BLUF domain-containing protein [Cytophagales bacterium]|nr:BLUF domain-containing protein [Cytophagales bacterium]